MLLLDNEGFSDDLRKTFLVFLISHHRPMAELLNPNLKDLNAVYNAEFVQMAQVETSMKELESTRERLIDIIHRGITPDEKEFLLSFKSRAPEWALLGMENQYVISNLPSVKWKLHNLGQMPASKHRIALERLSEVLQRR